MHAATKELEGQSVGFKNELLFSRGVNYNELPSWQKRGIGLWHEKYDKEGYDPLRKEAVLATRNRIHVEYELPIGDAYGDMVIGLLE